MHPIQPIGPRNRDVKPVEFNRVEADRPRPRDAEEEREREAEARRKKQKRGKPGSDDGQGHVDVRA